MSTHLKRVYRKQGIRKQTELVRRVLLLETQMESLLPTRSSADFGRPPSRVP